jgi:hypothetical protein
LTVPDFVSFEVGDIFALPSLLRRGSMNPFNNFFSGGDGVFDWAGKAGGSEPDYYIDSSN